MCELATPCYPLINVINLQLSGILLPKNCNTVEIMLFLIVFINFIDERRLNISGGVFLLRIVHSLWL